MADANAFLIYLDDNGVSNVNVRFEGEDVWLAAEQLQQLFQASQRDVHHHIQQIYADGELLAEATNKKYLLVRNEGNRSVSRNILALVCQGRGQNSEVVQKPYPTRPASRRWQAGRLVYAREARTPRVRCIAVTNIATIPEDEGHK